MFNTSTLIVSGSFGEIKPCNFWCTGGRLFPESEQEKAQREKHEALLASYIINAKDEFIKEIEDKSVRCVTIFYNKPVGHDVVKCTFNLKENYDEEEYNEFLNNLDFTYDNHLAICGSQSIEGTIWYENPYNQKEKWSTRKVVRGHEFWEEHEIPDIPNFLK